MRLGDRPKSLILTGNLLEFAAIWAEPVNQADPVPGPDLD